MGDMRGKASVSHSNQIIRRRRRVPVPISHCNYRVALDEQKGARLVSRDVPYVQKCLPALM